MATDIKEKGYKVHLVPFEVGSEGHILKHTKQNIINTLKSFNIKLPAATLTDLGLVSLLTTHSIFHAYQTSEWVSPPFLTPNRHGSPRSGGL